MKKTLIAAALLMFAGSTFADSTAVLQVQGKLKTDVCTPELSDGGVVDFGYIRLGTLKATEENQIGERDISLTISCKAPTKVYWTMKDNVHDSNAKIKVSDVNPITADYYQFGVGKTAAGVNIGDYTVIVKDKIVQADGASAASIADNTEGAAGNWQSSGTPRSDSMTMMTFANTGQLDPIAITTAVVPLVITLAIQGTDTLAITDDQPINGQATITLGYL